MIYLGFTQQLQCEKFTDHGVYLVSNASGEPFTAESELDISHVLLPQNELPKDLKRGDSVSAFIYRDSSDRPVATLKTPLLTFGRVARLKVKDVGSIGAFLDWGLAKDLFLPFKEQTYRVRPGDEILTSLYIDKSQRLCATMKIYPYLSSDSEYKADDRVEGTVYELIESFGAYIAVDDKYSALVPAADLHQKLRINERVQARVTKRLPDGRLSLSLREKAYMQLDKDALVIYEILENAGGFLPYGDKTAPDVISSTFHLSKNAFKRAIGHLMKEKKITISDNGIQKI